MTQSLTGATVSSTYGKLVQVVGNDYYDGFGNLLDLSNFHNVDGGSAYSIYNPNQRVNGGNA